jgi:hypothetical protein
MGTLLIVVWIVGSAFGLATLLVRTLWLEGTPRRPWIPLSFMGEYWRYRRVRKAVAEGEPEPRGLRVYEILFAASLASLSAALILSLVALLTER